MHMFQHKIKQWCIYEGVYHRINYKGQKKRKGQKRAISKTSKMVNKLWASSLSFMHWKVWFYRPHRKC